MFITMEVMFRKNIVAKIMSLTIPWINGTWMGDRLYQQQFTFFSGPFFFILMARTFILKADS